MEEGEEKELEEEEKCSFVDTFRLAIHPSSPSLLTGLLRRFSSNPCLPPIRILMHTLSLGLLFQLYLYFMVHRVTDCCFGVGTVS